MIKDRLKELKCLLQSSLSTKSIKISKNGRIEIIFRFKPNILKTQEQVNEVENNALKKISSIFALKYKIVNMQKQPSLSYNIYARLLNSSSSHSQDKIKRYLTYFERNEFNKFVKTSFAEVHLVLMPYSTEEFQQFLFNEIS
jgi:hypothetical protein